jgi:hypothetical protein
MAVDHGLAERRDPNGSPRAGHPSDHGFSCPRDAWIEDGVLIGGTSQQVNSAAGRRSLHLEASLRRIHAILNLPFFSVGAPTRFMQSEE